MAKYKNKDTGVIVEAMQIEYSCQDTLTREVGITLIAWVNLLQ